jgi:ABC-2 type transport system ATP-binding protein
MYRDVERHSAHDHLRVTGLRKIHPGGAGVTDVSFSAPPGAITGFIGVNGAGKSTTFRCILGLTKADAGTVELFGAAATPSLRRRVGFLSEERGLFARESARSAIAFQARLKGMRKAEAFRRADMLLERIGLEARRGARIGELSKGNAQRVQILCALAHNPDLLILDEPLSGLDPVGQSEMLSLLAEFRSGGGAVLFSTHAMAAAQGVCDRIVMIAGGRTVFEGDTADAAEQAPHGAVVVTPDAEALSVAAAAVGGRVQPMPSRIGEAGRWRVILPAHVPHPALVRAMAEANVSVAAFEPIKADLEGAFWQLAAPAAMAAALQSAA